jgi:hypothetical protein
MGAMAFASLAKKAPALQQASTMSSQVLKTVTASFPAQRPPQARPTGFNPGRQMQKADVGGAGKGFGPLAARAAEDGYGKGCG